MTAEVPSPALRQELSGVFCALATGPAPARRARAAVREALAA